MDSREIGKSTPATTHVAGRLIQPMEHQIVVVIGVSSGIGHEVARQTSAQGARLSITAAIKQSSPPPPSA